MHLSQNADKFLEKLDKNIKDRITERLKKLADDPVPSDSRFIGRDDSGDAIFRQRTGDYRALYKVKTKEKIVLIVKIDKRDKIY